MWRAGELTCGTEELAELNRALQVQLVVERGEEVRLAVQVALHQHALHEAHHAFRRVVQRDLAQVQQD
jgi:hypothetical protein